MGDLGDARLTEVADGAPVGWRETKEMAAELLRHRRTVVRVLAVLSAAARALASLRPGQRDACLDVIQKIRSALRVFPAPVPSDDRGASPRGTPTGNHAGDRRPK